MAFVLPTFNVPINYWYNTNWNAAWLDGAGVVPGPDAFWDAQLRFPPKDVLLQSLSDVRLHADLLNPPGEDIRPPLVQSADFQYWMDRVEVPAGSGCYYFVESVLDVAKGFGNEYRLAVIRPTYELDGSYWSIRAHWPYAPPWPLPLP